MKPLPIRHMDHVVLLCHDLAYYLRWMGKYRTDVHGIWAFDFTMADPVEERDRELTDAPLYFQRRFGYHSGGSRSRLIHRCADGRYDTGRHTSPLVPRVVDDGLFVLWFGWSPMRYSCGRKLQIQQRIPPRDRAAGLGRQHLVTPPQLEAAYLEQAGKAQDLWVAYSEYSELIQTLARRAGHPLEAPASRPEEGPCPTPALR